MNIYAIVSVGMVIAIVGGAIWWIRSRLAARSDFELPAPPKAPRKPQEARLGKTPGWISFDIENRPIALYNRSQAVSIEGVLNKDQTKLRLKVTMSDGRVAYGEPVATAQELYAQIDKLMKA